MVSMGTDCYLSAVSHGVTLYYDVLLVKTSAGTSKYLLPARSLK